MKQRRSDLPVIRIPRPGNDPKYDRTRLIYDLTGLTFGKLKALSRELRPKPSKKGNFYWWCCQCECGNICHIDTDVLIRSTKSCGCDSDNRPWTSKYRVEIIVRRQETGESCAVIAKHFGVSKGTVVGILYRAELLGFDYTKHPALIYQTFPEPGTCLYSYSDPGTPEFHWCGAKATKKSYCAEHAAKTFVKPAPEKKSKSTYTNRVDALRMGLKIH